MCKKTDEKAFTIESRACRCGNSTNPNYSCERCGGYPHSSDAKITEIKYIKKDGRWIAK